MVHIGDKAMGYLPKKIFGESSEGKDVNYFAKILESEESKDKLRALTR